MSDTFGFSSTAYRDLVGAFLERGYLSVPFGDAVPGERHLILRHDLDQSLEAAVEIAGIEAKLGVSATYFVLLRTEMYNPFSNDGLRALSAIRAFGHSIGLHFDPTLYPPEETSQDKAAAWECSVLEALLGNRVEAISLHRPSPSTIGTGDMIAGRLNAYGKRFINEMEYCSDSRGRWGDGGPPLDRHAVAAGRALQLLTHPIWWAGQTVDAAATRLQNLLEIRTERLRAELAENNTVYPREFARKARTE